MHILLVHLYRQKAALLCSDCTVKFFFPILKPFDFSCKRTIPRGTPSIHMLNQLRGSNTGSQGLKQKEKKKKKKKGKTGFKSLPTTADS